MGFELLIGMVLASPSAGRWEGDVDEGEGVLWGKKW